MCPSYFDCGEKLAFCMWEEGKSICIKSEGPIINHLAQVLDTEKRPIKGLYGAGDCIGWPTANVYWEGEAL